MIKLDKLKTEKNKLDIQIKDLEHKELINVSIPELEKSIGRCFKYKNSYGGHLDRWWLYVKVTGINKKDMSFTTMKFQNTSLNRIEIEYSRKSNYDGKNSFDSFHGGNYIEIKQSEFNRAKKVMIKKVTKLLS